MQRRMWREGQRRSPRICALDVSKAQVSRVDPFERPRNKRIQQQEPSSSNEQDDRRPNPEDLRKNHEPPILKSINVVKYDNDRATTPGQLNVTPDKRLLEFIVDILQRRDTHEIFAEPVDPNEVEDYYEIIKEPMDFGTIRAKLHEGMYHSLQQFEHDVFLISRNAMHFNSSGTIYFRQARVIDELAKRVFHVLKTDPANFEMEFAGTRRRSNRKVKGKVRRSSTNGSSSKHATNSRFSSVAANISRKSLLPISSSSKLNIRTTAQEFPGYPRSDIIDDELPLGEGVSSFEADNRSSYKPWRSVFSENCSVVSPNSSKLLMLQDGGYSESLMRFAKGLGPAAQMVANRKIKEATNYLNFQANQYRSCHSSDRRFANILVSELKMEDEKLTKMNQDLPSDFGEIRSLQNWRDSRETTIIIGGQNQALTPISESMLINEILGEDGFLQQKKGLMSANVIHQYN